MVTVVAYLRRLLLDAADNQRGVVAIAFAFGLLLLVIALLGAVDVAGVSSARNTLQDALDNATVAVGAANTSNQATIDRVGGAYFNAELVRSGKLANAHVTFTPGSTTITGQATAVFTPIFISIVSGSPITLTANSQVTRGIDQTVELALVLDTTGSMSGSKITTLKSAATSLVTTLTAQGTTAIKIAVIPFANYVNVGVAARNQSWTNVPADYSTTSTSTPSCSYNTCQSSTYSCTQYNDGVPYQATCTNYFNCVAHNYVPCPGPKTTTSNYTFRGCVGSPPYPQNVRDMDPLRKYPGFLNLTCTTQLTPLTNNVTTVKNAITALSASGATYIPAGLAWGLNALSQVSPLTEADAYDTTNPNRKPRKILILMTDGANTQLYRATNGAHDISPASGVRAIQADTWTGELCTNIKTQKIEVYTVAFQVGADQIAKDLIKNCATDAAHYYDATDNAALTAAFANIGASIQALHISH